MASIQDIIKLAGQGKVFVVDESGDIKLVILNLEEYQEMLLGKLKRQIADIESVNKEILKAQLEETKPEVTIGPIAKSGYLGGKIPTQDLRDEVIDPSFNFDVPLPGQDLEDI